jgi:hypothetical protein
MRDSPASRSSARHERLFRAPVLLVGGETGTRQWRGGEFAEVDHRGNGVRRRRRYSFTSSRFSGGARAYRARDDADRLQVLNGGVDGGRGGGWRVRIPWRWRAFRPGG